jgi:DNA polymerase-3 subunit beta
MKITVLQKNLKQGIFVTSPITGKNTNLPILNNLLLSASNGSIRLLATDLELGVSTVVRGKIEEDGALTVDAKLLSSYVSLLPNNKLEISSKEAELTLESEGYKTKMKGELADDYPLIPELDKENYYQVNINEFKQAISSVVFAVMFNENRLALSGVLFSIDNETLTMAGTDSYRLAEKVIKVSSNIVPVEGEGPRRIIIPIKTLQELARIIAGDFSDNKDVENIRIYITDNQIAFSFDTVEVVSRLIDEQYPDYKQIIPNQFKSSCTVDREELVRAVKASALFSKSGVNDINLDMKTEQGAVVVSATSGQAGENTAVVGAKIEGGDNGVVINYKYLIDGLNSMGTQLVKIELVDGMTPCLLRPVGAEGYLYIVMPIRK